jgi:CBS domain
MRAIDVMMSEVISVDEDATVPAVARLLAERGISAVPVVDKNGVIGMVSEGDLLHRAETGTERRRSWWLDMVASTNKLAGDFLLLLGGGPDGPFLLCVLARIHPGTHDAGREFVVDAAASRAPLFEGNFGLRHPLPAAPMVDGAALRTDCLVMQLLLTLVRIEDVI